MDKTRKEWLFFTSRGYFTYKLPRLDKCGKYLLEVNSTNGNTDRKKVAYQHILTKYLAIILYSTFIVFYK